jgi:hypothetical protein
MRRKRIAIAKWFSREALLWRLDYAWSTGLRILRSVTRRLPARLLGRCDAGLTCSRFGPGGFASVQIASLFSLCRHTTTWCSGCRTCSARCVKVAHFFYVHRRLQLYGRAAIEQEFPLLRLTDLTTTTIVASATWSAGVVPITLRFSGGVRGKGPPAVGCPGNRRRTSSLFALASPFRTSVRRTGLPAEALGK